VSPTLTAVASALAGALTGAALTGALARAWLAHSRRALRTAQHQLSHDPLTRLPNRRAFLGRLDAALRGGTAVAVVMLDLDRFKAVNDTYGHAAGDELLRQVAHRLRALPPPVRLAARLQGDEFVLLTDAGPAGACTAWQAIAAAPFTVTDGQRVAITASIGVAVAAHSAAPRRDRPDPGRLLHEADQAMYRAKTTGAGVVLADPQAHQPVQDRPAARLRDGRPPPEPQSPPGRR
jgi:diguanylate cyclase (GGDEF)-like protein